MEGFRFRTVVILGRQPALGVAELESLYGADGLARLGGAALLETAAEEIDFQRLGGAVKIARILTVIPTTAWSQLRDYLLEKIPEHLDGLPEGKFTLGLSVYGLPVKPDELNRGLLQIKKRIRATGRPVRIVPNKEPALSSAQVLHNKLTHRGGWELLFISYGQSVILAQTLFVQDIDAYAARDQARPKRDARVGMLPPKLAQILINLAGPKSMVLDPFCGTGVVLQEALLAGFNVYGTDIEPRMVGYSRENIEWLMEKYPKIKEGRVSLETADATRHRWQRGYDCVVSEVFLGRPLSALPSPEKLKGIINDANLITKKFLSNLAPQAPTGTTLCLAVPAWKSRNGFLHLPVLAKLADFGYNNLDLKHVERPELIYHREGQMVGREIVIIKKV